MKKIVIGLLALTLTTGAFAQGNKNQKNNNNKEWKQHGKDKMDDLNLSSDQQRQMKDINESFKSKMQALKQDQSLSAEARKQRRMDILNERHRQMEAILTPEQKKKWQEDKKEWKDERKEDRKEARKDHDKSDRDQAKARPGNRGQNIINKLDLTPEQTARYKQLNQDHQAAIENVRKNTSLTEEQKNEQIEQLRLKHRQATESLLTAEQKEKMKSFQKDRRGRGANRMTK